MSLLIHSSMVLIAIRRNVQNNFQVFLSCAKCHGPTLMAAWDRTLTVGTDYM